MDKRIAAVARVQVLIEVPTSVWGPDCTVAQIMDQASREGVEKVAQMIAKGGGRVIGEPTVVATIGTRE